MRVYSNVAQSVTLSSGVSDTDDTLPTSSADLAADGWPVPGTGETASARIVDGTDVEVVTYTGISGGTLTGVVRDADGDTSAQSWPSGATVEHVFTADGATPTYLPFDAGNDHEAARPDVPSTSTVAWFNVPEEPINLGTFDVWEDA